MATQQSARSLTETTLTPAGYDPASEEVRPVAVTILDVHGRGTVTVTHGEQKLAVDASELEEVVELLINAQMIRDSAAASAL